MLEVNTQALANTLTQYEWNLFAKIRPLEYIARIGWDQQETTTPTPTVRNIHQSIYLIVTPLSSSSI